MDEVNYFRIFLMGGICLAISFLIALLLDTITAGFANMWITMVILSLSTISAVFFYGGFSGSDDEVF